MSHGTLEAVHPLYGMMAEFETPTQLVEAARKVRDAGFRKFDAYTPYPIHELDDAMDLHDNRISLFTLIGGIVGGCAGFGLCSWVEAVALPLNIGGRPLISVPMFIPITFELTILFGGLTAAIGMILLNGLPLPYHPVFNVEKFANASRSKFFICIESDDPKFDPEGTANFLESLGAEEISEVGR
jgi:hypothetical protein